MWRRLPAADSHNKAADAASRLRGSDLIVVPFSDVTRKTGDRAKVCKTRFVLRFARRWAAVRLGILTAGLFVAASCLGAEPDTAEDKLARHGWSAEVYKVAGEARLKLWRKNPPGHAETDRRPAIIFFYGGGWKARNLAQFQRQGEHFARRGMVAVLADYRVRSRYGGTPFDCVEDAKSAIRHLRATAASRGVDPDRIVAGGGSAGGHLAAAAALVPGFDAPGDPAESCIPDALILFNPAYGHYHRGYGFPDLQERWKEISPIAYIRTGAPPSIVFLGDRDKFISVETAKAWERRMEAAGVRSELHLYKGRAHGFFNRGDDFADTLAKADAFLVSLGYLEPLDKDAPAIFR